MEVKWFLYITAILPRAYGVRWMKRRVLQAATAEPHPSHPEPPRAAFSWLPIPHRLLLAGMCSGRSTPSVPQGAQTSHPLLHFSPSSAEPTSRSKKSWCIVVIEETLVRVAVLSHPPLCGATTKQPRKGPVAQGCKNFCPSSEYLLGTRPGQWIQTSGQPFPWWTPVSLLTTSARERSSKTFSWQSHCFPRKAGTHPLLFSSVFTVSLCWADWHVNKPQESYT